MTTPAIIDDDDIERDICGDIVSFLERDDVIGYDADRAVVSSVKLDGASCFNVHSR